MTKQIRSALEKPGTCHVLKKDGRMMRSQSANTIGAREQKMLPILEAGYMTASYF